MSDMTTDNDVSGFPRLLVVLGSGITILAAVSPWIEVLNNYPGPRDLHIGIGIGLGWISLVLGITVVVLEIMGKEGVFRNKVLFACGVVIAVSGGLWLTNTHFIVHLLTDWRGYEGIQIKQGIYLTVIGGLLIAGSSVIRFQQKSGW